MSAIAPSKRRMNPFSFPAETNVRFVLLILAVLMLAVSIGGLLGIALSLLSEPGQITPATEDQSTEISASTFGEVLGSLVVLVVMMLVVLVLAAVIYRGHPARIRRRKKLTPLIADKHPAVQGEIERLSRSVAVSPQPSVEMGPGVRGQNAQAFGLPKQYVLGLDGGLRLLLRRAPTLFQALLLHELAHIANRDVGRTYFAEALWRAAIYVTAVPFALLLGGIALIAGIATLLTRQMSASDLVLLVVMNLLGLPVVFLVLGVPLAVVAFIRASVLRAREFYADWRAALWGVETPLQSILATGAAKETEKRAFRLRRYHPSARQRLAMLQDPMSLFKVSYDLPIIAGLLLGFVITGLIWMTFKLMGIIQAGLNVFAAGLTELALDSSNVLLVSFTHLAVTVAGLIPLGIYLIVCVALGYLIAGTVGLQVQRESVASTVTGQRGCAGHLRLVGLAALVALGLEVGSLIAPPYLFSPLGAIIGGLVDPAMLLLIFPWLLGFAALTWLGLFYGRVFSRRILGSHTGTSSPVRKQRLLTIAQSALLGVMYVPLLAGRIAIIFPDPTADELLISVSFIGLIVAMVLTGLAFGATWLLMTILRRYWPPRCSYCEQITQHRYAVGQGCENCERDLTPWLFVETPFATAIPKQTLKPLPDAAE